MNHPSRIPLALPCVVDIYVDVSGISHSACNHSVGLGANGCIIDFVAEVIPAVPAHRRCRGNLRPLRTDSGVVDNTNQQHRGKSLHPTSYHRPAPQTTPPSPCAMTITCQTTYVRIAPNG